MPTDRLTYLGNRIRIAQKTCELTQQELADQTNVAVKTIQNIENGTMNLSYEILFPIVNRLVLSTSDLFNVSPDEKDEEIQRLIGKFVICNRESQIVLLRTLNRLAEELLALQNHKLDDPPG